MSGRLTSPAMRIAVCALVLFWTTVPPASAATYYWTRTSQTLTEISTVSVVSQGLTNNGDDSDPTSDDLAASHIDRGLSVPTVGGSGGNGGGGANENSAGAAGANGQNEGNTDGLDGPDGNGQNPGKGGKGGTRGTGGEATATAEAEGIGALNPDLQPVVEWSFIHSNWGTLDLEAGGGGGGGGGGGSKATFAGGKGGAGGVGQSATGSTDSRQDSEADVAATFTGPPLHSTTARITCDILWGDTWVGQRLNWQRGLNLTISISPSGGGNSTILTFTTLGNGLLQAQGTRRNGTTFTKTSTASLNDSAGAFGIGAGEFTDTVSVGDSVTIQTTPAGVFSRVFSDSQFRTGAVGGGGGFGGMPGQDGANGWNAGSGAAGGAGGAGGLFGFKGGNGGRGALGGTFSSDNLGLFQGVFSVTLDQP
jgi:hypothetical protein